MTTELNKTVARKTRSFVRSRGKLRAIIAMLVPGDVIGMRLAGTRQVEYINIDTVYALALRNRVAAEKAEKRRLRGKKK